MNASTATFANQHGYSDIRPFEVIKHNTEKKRGWFDAHGNRYLLADAPRYFYDYNF